MKLCIIGGGFTGLLSAITIKKHSPQTHVTLIESPTIKKNLYFGESAPPQALKWILEALKIPQEVQTKFILDWLTQTKSTVKYNFIWQNFLSEQDDGWTSGMPEMPSWEAVLFPHHSGTRLNHKVARPLNTEYRLYDLWQELLLKKQRSVNDFGPENNALYWYFKYHTMDQFNNHFLNGSASVHINSVETGEWLKKRFGNVIDNYMSASVIKINSAGDQIQSLELDTGDTITGDFYLDCSGLQRITAKHFDSEWNTPQTGRILHNRTLVLNSGYTENIDREMHPYTIGYGMKSGWMFGIPLLDRKAWGYVYDSDFQTTDGALEEMLKHVDKKKHLGDPFEIKWDPGFYKESWSGNHAKVGLACGFVDPFDANMIAIHHRQNRLLIGWLNGQDTAENSAKKYNNWINKTMNSVAQRVTFHQGLAPRNDSEYWQRNHQLAIDQDLASEAIDTLGAYEHCPAAEDAGDFIPFIDNLYLTETLWYGVDLSKRCRQSSEDVLKLADDYFKSYSRLNKQRAQIAPTMRQWYKEFDIDFDQFISFKN